MLLLQHLVHIKSQFWLSFKIVNCALLRFSHLLWNQVSHFSQKTHDRVQFFWQLCPGPFAVLGCNPCINLILLPCCWCFQIPFELYVTIPFNHVFVISTCYSLFGWLGPIFALVGCFGLLFPPEAQEVAKDVAADTASWRKIRLLLDTYAMNKQILFWWSNLIGTSQKMIFENSFQN